MDGISVATSVLAFATTSTHISIKLYSLSKQISNAPDTITFLANDVSMISGVLSQLGQLVQRDQTDGSQRIFSQAGLDLIDHSSQNCSKAFEDLSSMLDRATSQLARVSKSQKQTKINLSVPEKVRWPFLKADIKRLRADLQDAKSSLLLVLPLEHWIAIKKESSVDTQSKTKAALDMGSVKRTVEALWPEHTGHPSRPRESMSLQKSNTRGGGKEQDAHESDDASEEDDEDLQALESRSDMAFEMFASTKRSDPIDFDEVETVSFQLRPVAEEVNDKVEALWRSGVSRLAPNHLSGFFPREAVKHDALAGLYPSEQRAIWEVVESYGNEARIVSVKKTTWNLHIRDTVVKDVPGVQVLSLAKYGGYTDIDHTYPVAGYPAGNSNGTRYPHSYNEEGHHYRTQGRYETTLPYGGENGRYGRGGRAQIERPGYAGQYPDRDSPYLSSLMQYVPTASERRVGATKSPHKAKRRRIEEDSKHSLNDRSVPSWSRSPRPSRMTDRNRREITEYEHQEHEEILPKSPKNKVDSTGSDVLDFLLRKYTTYFESE